MVTPTSWKRSQAHPAHARTQGFTLIELLVVIAIIAILAAILMPSFIQAQKKPYDVAALQCGRAIITAEIPYKIQNGTYAGNVNQLGADTQEVCDQQGVRVIPDTGQANPNTAASGVIGVAVSNGTLYFTFKVFHPSGSGNYLYYSNGVSGDPAARLNVLRAWE